MDTLTSFRTLNSKLQTCKIFGKGTSLMPRHVLVLNICGYVLVTKQGVELLIRTLMVGVLENLI